MIKPMIFVWFVARSSWMVFVCPLAKTSDVSSGGGAEKSNDDRFIVGTVTSLFSRVAFRRM